MMGIGGASGRIHLSVAVVKRLLKVMGECDTRDGTAYDRAGEVWGRVSISDVGVLPRADPRGVSRGENGSVPRGVRPVLTE